MESPTTRPVRSQSKPRRACRSSIGIAANAGVDYREDRITDPGGTVIKGGDADGVVTRLGMRFHRMFERVALNADLSQGWTAWANLGTQWGTQDYRQYSARIGLKRMF